MSYRADWDAVTTDANGAPIPSGTVVTYHYTDGLGNTAQTTGTTVSFPDEPPSGVRSIVCRLDARATGYTMSDPVEASLVFNKAPFITQNFPDIAIPVGQSRRINLANAATDPDNDALTWTVVSNNTLVVSASISTIIGEPGVNITAGPERGTALVTLTVTDPYGASDSVTFAVTSGPPPNRPPRLIGQLAKQTMNPNRSRSIDIAGFFTDPDGDVLTFTASPEPQQAVPQTPNSVAISGSTITIRSGVSPGSFIGTVTATDPDGLSVTMSFEVETVTEPVNQPPSVDITTNPQTVDGGTNVSLAGTASDPDGSIASTLWLANGGEFVGSTNNLSATWRAPANPTTEDVSYQITLRATDNQGLSATDQVIMTVRANPMRPPVWDDPNPEAPYNEFEGLRGSPSQSINLNDHCTDPEGGPLSYQVVLGGGQLFNLEGSTLTFRVRSDTLTTQETVTIRALDNQGLAATQTFTGRVLSPLPPRWFDPIPDLRVPIGNAGRRTIDLLNYCENPNPGDNNNLLRFSVVRDDDEPTGLTARIKQGTFSELEIVPTGVGTFEVHVDASISGLSTSHPRDTFEVEVFDPDAPTGKLDPPTADPWTETFSGSHQPAQRGTDLNVHFTNPNAIGIMRYTATGSVLPELVVAINGNNLVLTISPTPATYDVTVTGQVIHPGNDRSLDSDVTSVEVTVIREAPPQPLIVWYELIPTQNIDIGDTVEVDLREHVRLQAGNFNDLDFAITIPPGNWTNGVEFDASISDTGILSITANRAAETGRQYAMGIVASNDEASNSPLTSDLFPMYAIAPEGNRPPFWGPARTFRWTYQGGTRNFALDATDPDGDPLTFSVVTQPTTPQLTAGIVGNGVSFTWTGDAPTVPVNDSITLRVADQFHNVDQRFNIAILPFVVRPGYRNYGYLGDKVNDFTNEERVVIRIEFITEGIEDDELDRYTYNSEVVTIEPNSPNYGEATVQTPRRLVDKFGVSFWEWRPILPDGENEATVLINSRTRFLYNPEGANPTFVDFRYQNQKRILRVNRPPEWTNIPPVLYRTGDSDVKHVSLDDYCTEPEGESFSYLVINAGSPFVEAGITTDRRLRLERLTTFPFNVNVTVRATDVNGNHSDTDIQVTTEQLPPDP